MESIALGFVWPAAAVTRNRAKRRGLRMLGGCIAATILAGRALAQGAPPFLPPTGDVSLRAALAATLVANPDLAVFSAETRAREARALQAGLLPNPEISAEVEEFAGSGSRRAFRSAETTIRLSQLIELGGKRSKRRDAALLERDIAGWDFESRRATVLAEATEAFISALSGQERLTVSAKLVDLAGESLRSVDASVRAGASSPVERKRAQVFLAEAAAQHRLFERELAVAYQALSASWGSSVVTFRSVLGDLERIEEPPPLEGLVQGIGANPDLARWTTEIASREAELALSRAGRVPDVRVGAGPRYYAEGDSAAAVVELSVPLPLFDRRQGQIAEANERLSKARLERTAADIFVRSALARDHERLRAAFDHARALRDTILPEARAAYEAATEAYAQGALRYVDVLDVQRTLFDLRDQYVATLADYQRALTALERLAGGAAGPTLDQETQP